MKGQTQTAIADVRRAVYNLRPPALDELGLISAIREHSARIAGESLHIEIEAPVELPQLSAAVEVAVYRVALEALMNVVRHAEARTCMVRISLNGGLVLKITDDGLGMPANAAIGVGISAMRERVEELGGVFHIESTPGEGTTIVATLPLLPQFDDEHHEDES